MKAAQATYVSRSSACSGRLESVSGYVSRRGGDVGATPIEKRMDHKHLIDAAFELLEASLFFMGVHGKWHAVAKIVAMVIKFLL